MTIEDFRSRTKRAGILYVDVYPFVRDDDGRLRVLLLRRRPDVVMPGVWQGVSGKLGEGERIAEGFARQVERKTGQSPVHLFKLDVVNMFYDDYYDTVMLVPVAGSRLASTQIVLDEALHDASAWLYIEDAVQRLEWKTQRENLRELDELVQRGISAARTISNREADR